MKLGGGKMRNYIHKLANDNIKKNKDFYKHIFISIFLTFSIVFLTNILSSSFDRTLYESRAISHGKWDVVISNANEDMISNLETIDYDKLGYLYYGGEVIYNGSFLGCIGSYDEIGYELSNIRLIEGNFPLTDKEIVLEKTMALLLNANVGETIVLDISYQDQIKQNEYKIVGIVEDYVSGWNSRGLSFITHSLDYYEYDLMLTGKEALLFWNNLYWKVMDVNDESLHDEIQKHNIDIYNKNLYPDYIEVSIKGPGYAAFTNESDFLLQAVEIIVISFISLLSSMMASLTKRESQFVLLRSMGMTYNQLKKLIAYEGYLLSFRALFLSVVSSLSLSVIVMYFYSLINNSVFIWSINFSSLSIQFIIACLVVYIGLVFPVLTVYNLPLTRKNGEYIYHPKTRTIRKPRFSFFVRNEISNNKTWSIFIIFFISLVMIRSINIIDSTIDCLKQREITYQSNRDIDFIWQVNSWQNERYNYYDFDFAELEENNEIHIYNTKLLTDRSLKWKNMNNEDRRILSNRNRNGEVDGNLICIENDEKIKDYLVSKGYSEFLDLKENEVAVFIPNHNYNEPRTITISDNSDANVVVSKEYYPYTNDVVRKKRGLYAKDEGLQVGESITISNQSLMIKEVMILDDELIRDYFEEYTLIVNSETFKNCYQEYGNYYVIDVDNNEARDQVVSFFVNQGVYGNETSFTNIYLEDMKTLYNMESQYVRNMTYNVLLIIVYMTLIYMMRILSSHKKRRHIGLLRNVGMTKRTIYKIHILYASILMITAVLLVIIFWLILSQISFTDYSFIAFINEYNIILKVLCVFGVYIVYLVCMLLPIKNVLDESPLNLIARR